VKGWRALLPVAILGGPPFKETTGVLCAAFLLLNAPRRERLAWALGTAAAFVALKVGIDVALGSSVPFLSLSFHQPVGRQHLRIVSNPEALWESRLFWHPVWINAGTLAALLLLPGRDRTLCMLKSVALLFTVSTFFAGNIVEYRI
jgi:hypothetical protein